MSTMSEFQELIKKRKLDLLESIDSGTSIFKYIPDQIGNVLYCDTNQNKAEPMAPADAKRKKINVICIGVISLSLIWGLCAIKSLYVLAAILSAIALYICYKKFDTSFSGTDVFMGDKGFAVVSFSDNRDNIVEKKIVLFDEVSCIFTGETINKRNYTYTGTDFHFVFYKKPTSEGVYQVAYQINGSYSDEKPEDPMCPLGAPEEYALMKVVEKEWTSYFLNLHKNDMEINFPIMTDDAMYPDVIKMGHGYLNIDGTVYNRDNTKKIYFSNGNLVIEHMNHQKKWFGFVEKGDKHSIPLSQLGNRQAFMLLFDSLYYS